MSQDRIEDVLKDLKIENQSINSKLDNSEISRDDLFMLLRTLIYAIRDPIHMDVINNAMRVVLNTNLVSLANTTDLRTITTVSTVTNVANQTNMGGYPTDQVTVNESEIAWATGKRSLMI